MPAISASPRRDLCYVAAQARGRLRNRQPDASSPPSRLCPAPSFHVGGDAVIPMTDDDQAVDAAEAAAKRQRLDAVSARLHACAKRLLDALAVRLHAWRDQLPVADDEDEPSEYPEYPHWDVVPFVAWDLWGEPKFADYVQWLVPQLHNPNFDRILSVAAAQWGLPFLRFTLKDALEKLVAKQRAGAIRCTAIPQHVPESERIRGGVPDEEWDFMHYTPADKGRRMIAETRPGSEAEFRRYSRFRFSRPGAPEADEPQGDEPAAQTPTSDASREQDALAEHDAALPELANDASTVARKKRGRPPGSGSLRPADERFFVMMAQLIKDEPWRSFWYAADQIVGQYGKEIADVNTKPESKRTRLASDFPDWLEEEIASGRWMELQSHLNAWRERQQ